MIGSFAHLENMAEKCTITGYPAEVLSKFMLTQHKRTQEKAII